MSIIWHKVWRDLTHNKMRTLLAVLSTTVGIFALGVVFGMSGVTRTRLTEDYRATLPAHLTFYGGPFSQSDVDAILKEPDVADAEGEIHTFLRWKLPGEVDWRNGNLMARADYDAQHMNLINLLDGRWPEDHTLAIERQAAQYLNIPTGSTIIVKFGKYERSLPITGIVRVPTAFPPQFGGDTTFYATSETVTWLTGSHGFDQLNVRLETFSQETANSAARHIEKRLRRSGIYVAGYLITDPNVHWMQKWIDTMLLILAIVGGLSLGLNVFLIVNTMNTIIVQQVRQIGVMKVIGATFSHVVGIYLAVALIYGMSALLLAVPLGAIGAYLMTCSMLDILNVAPGAFRVSPVAIGIQTIAGIAVPLLAALFPVISGARITPHRAILFYGLGNNLSQGWLEHFLGHIRFLPRPLALSLRNTLRQKVRVALTLLTLVLSGLTFILVMSIGTSINNTIEAMLQTIKDDVRIVFDHPYPVAQLVEIAESVPGVVRAQVWGQYRATLALTNDPQIDQEAEEELPIRIWGVPPDCATFTPRIISGRRLLPDDEHAILLNHDIALEEGIHVGDEVKLTIEGHESTWTVVGLLLPVNLGQRDNFVPFEALMQETGYAGRGTLVSVLSDVHDSEHQERLSQALREAFATRHIEVADSWSAAEEREEDHTQFGVLIYLMLVMAILSAVVGSISLMGTLAMNVVERQREIGVMRAIGATSFAIARIFVGEGVLLGILSWLIVVPFSYPGARIFSKVVGDTLMHFPLEFSFSLSGVLLWLGIVIVFSTLASLWPALRATKVRVREALTYE